MSSAVDIVYAGEQLHVVDCADRFERALSILANRRNFESSTSLPFKARVGALAALSRDILRRNSSLRRALPSEGLAFLSTFLQERMLEELVKREVGDLERLSGFVAVSERKGIRLLPRGLVGHWVAGNVPLLAIFSWAVSVALGNRNVVRLSSRQADVMTPLLGILEASGQAGARIAAETLVVSFDRADAEAHRLMSRACDVRIAWGGRDAVESIRDLPSKWECEDIVFGPRMSFAVVDPDLMDDGATRRLATDICVFDQLACSSPQIVFVRNPSETGAVQTFVDRFSLAMNQQAATFPRHALDFSETFRIELDRARTVLDGGSIRRDAATSWTVAMTRQPEEKLDCANRFVQVVPARTLEEILEYLPGNVQTVVTMLRDDEFETFSERAAQIGVCRMPAPGEGNNFENPWDGVGLVSRLTRYATRTLRAAKQE